MRTIKRSITKRSVKDQRNANLVFAAVLIMTILWAILMIYFLFVDTNNGGFLITGAAGILVMAVWIWVTAILRR